MIRALLISVLLLVPLPALAQAEVPADGAVRRGDRWIFDLKDELTGEKRNTYAMVVTDVSADEVVTRINPRGATETRMVVFTPDWDRIDDSAWKYRPNDGAGIRRPLTMGAEWRFESDASNMTTGTVLHTAGSSKVVARETITTEAGTLDTFRIETVLRQVNTRDQSKGSDVKVTTWYAPSVNHWARRVTETRIEGRVRDHFSEELVEYSRKP